MDKVKVINRSAVYRAIYYSGFNFSRNINNRDEYLLKSKISGVYINILHEAESNNCDLLTITKPKNLEEKDSKRLERLVKKFTSRCKNLKIEEREIHE